MNSGSLSRTGLPDSHASLPTIPSPITLRGPRHRFSNATLQLTGLLQFRRSGLRRGEAGSPHTAGRIEFVILRTGRSLPVAPHLVSRRSSYVQLQAGERMPGEDFHLSD
jgi:hypothetical protein